MAFTFNPFTGTFDVVDRKDYHSGDSVIETGETLIIKEDKQMINFTILVIDGDLVIEGDLWLA